MIAFVSMLRGINVGGQKKISMETLRGIYEGLGFAHVRTYVQSGNVVFVTSEQDRTVLTKRIETHIEQTCGYHVPIFIRSAQELQKILASNPFLTARHEDPSKLHVSFLYHIPTVPMWSKLTSPGDSVDEFARVELAIYLFCPNGYGKTKLSNAFFERKLGMPVTTRNWNTVKTLYTMILD